MKRSEAERMLGIFLAARTRAERLVTLAAQEPTPDRQQRAHEAVASSQKQYARVVKALTCAPTAPEGAWIFRRKPARQPESSDALWARFEGE